MTRSTLLAALGIGVVAAIAPMSTAQARVTQQSPEQSGGPMVPAGTPQIALNNLSYTVTQGDTLWSLGQRYGLTIAQLAGFNHLPDPNMIQVGLVLTIPPADYVAPALPGPSQSAPVAPQSAPVALHQVQSSYQAPAVSSGGWSGPWACIAQRESGGNPAENTGNGFYGGLQFTMGTWQANGGSGNPANASIAQQEAVAARVQATQGFGAWPNTSRMCGL